MLRELSTLDRLVTGVRIGVTVAPVALLDGDDAERQRVYLAGLSRGENPQNLNRRTAI